MSMNYLPYISWGVFGNKGSPLAKATQAHYFVSWGMMSSFASKTFNWLTSWYWWNNPYGS